MLCGLLLVDRSLTCSWLVDCWLVILADVLSLFFSTGNRFCYLSLTALPVDYKVLGKKTEPTLLGSFWTSFFGFSSASFEAKILDETPAPENQKKYFRSPSPRKTATSSFGVCSPAALWNVRAVSRHQLCRALPNSLWFYLYVFPYSIPVCHCCIRVAARDQMLQVLLWTPGQVPPRRTKPVP